MGSNSSPLAELEPIIEKLVDPIGDFVTFHDVNAFRSNFRAR
jgi:hypothetical protein